MRRLPRLAVFVCTIGLLALAACDLRTSRTATDGKLEVASTVSPITNLVDNVGGDRIALTGLVPEGVNSHTYEPAPTDARVLGRARLFFANGLHLEEPLMKLAEANLDEQAEIVKLGDITVSEGERIYDFSFPREAGNPNPHVWTNPIYAKKFVQEIAERLSQTDASNKSYFSRNAEQTIALIDELDAALRQASSTIPPERRKLLTYHDSFPYFAREYGWKVIGAIQPTDFSEPSPRDVAQLIDQIRSEDVKAIFGSEVFPSAVLEQISKETGAAYVDDLRDDDLPGDPGDAEHSYLSLMRFDYVTIIEALGGDPRGLDTLDVTNLRASDARYH
jgi:ABC-type Zn uptake system ZnuABC Zn-binding protein ZnuA